MAASEPPRPLTMQDRLLVAAHAESVAMDNKAYRVIADTIIECVRCCDYFPECAHVVDESARVDAEEGRDPGEALRVASPAREETPRLVYDGSFDLDFLHPHEGVRHGGEGAAEVIDCDSEERLALVRVGETLVRRPDGSLEVVALPGSATEGPEGTTHA